jgi:hypothetical protein
MGSPWRPPELATLGPLGIGIAVVGGGEIQEAHVDWDPSHRVVASEYAGENLFDRIADHDELEALQAIADLTNPHVLDQMGQIRLVPPEDRIYGAGAGLVMAAFVFPATPSRFTNGMYGVYYAALAEETAVRETIYHRKRFLAGTGPAVLEMSLLHAHLDARMVDLRRGLPCPNGIYHDDDYSAGQQFGAVVRRLREFGVLYSSVRDPGGECVAVFRPRALGNCRAVRTLEYHWDGMDIVVR